MPVNSMGLQTHRDGFVTDMDRAALKRRIETFRNPDLPDVMVAQAFYLKDSTEWKIKEARAAIMADKEWNSKLTQIYYRPFDVRDICYHPALIDRMRDDLMHHMLGPGNLALATMRQTKSDTWQHALVADKMATAVYVEIKDGCNLFPLYLAPEPKPPEKKKTRGNRFTHMMLFEEQAQYTAKRPNLNPDILAALTETYGKAMSPEAIFHYIYAVLYSPPYRERYREFLKSDFPRIPFTADIGLFRKMAAIGEQLVALHLLKSPLLDKPGTRFHTPGDNRVGRNAVAGRRYEPEAQRLYINATQYFDNISAELWETRIGGYQVLDKWLKDRADRHLSPADVRHYCRTATALAQTLKLQEKLTDFYPKVEEQTVVFTENA